MDQSPGLANPHRTQLRTPRFGPSARSWNGRTSTDQGAGLAVGDAQAWLTPPPRATSSAQFVLRPLLERRGPE